MERPIGIIINNSSITTHTTCVNAYWVVHFNVFTEISCKINTLKKCFIRYLFVSKGSPRWLSLLQMAQQSFKMKTTLVFKEKPLVFIIYCDSTSKTKKLLSETFSPNISFAINYKQFIAMKSMISMLQSLTTQSSIFG